MTLKQIHAPHLNAIVKFGRKQPKHLAPRLKLSDYITDKTKLPSPPSSVDYSSTASTSLSDAYLNTSLGDCVIAGYYHAKGVATANAGDAFNATNEQVTKDYSAIGGYVPGNESTDNGCDEITALNYWTSTGDQGGTKILGFLQIDETNVQETQLACYLFENLFYGMCLPDAWISPFPSSSGFVWDVAGAADFNNGHCVAGYGYDTTGVLVDSWGLKGKITYEANKKYCASANGGALYAIITPDIIAKASQKALNGFDWTTLLTNAKAMGAKIVLPTLLPAPAPKPPSPAPAPVPSDPLTECDICKKRRTDDGAE